MRADSPQPAARAVDLIWSLASKSDVWAQISSVPLSPKYQIDYGNSLTFWSRMDANKKRAIGEGMAGGAIAGAFIRAYPAMSEGSGGELGGNSLGFVAAGALLGGLIGGTAGYLTERRWPSPSAPATSAGYSLLNPCAGQFDLEVGSLFGFTGPGSIVRVREFNTEGTGLHFASMDMNSEQMPAVDLRYWITGLDAVHFRFRYFNLGGSHFSSTPIFFNGSVIPGGPDQQLRSLGMVFLLLLLRASAHRTLSALRRQLAGGS